MSYDSVVQLADGRSGHYDSWHPPVMAWLLGLFDASCPARACFWPFYSAAVWGAGLLLLRSGRPGRGVAIPPYTDFRHAAACPLSGHHLEGCAVRRCRHRRFRALAAAAAAWQARADALWPGCLSCALLLSLAALARQNGFLLLPIAALSLGVIAARHNPGAPAGAMALGLLAACLVMLGLSNFALGFAAMTARAPPPASPGADL